LKPGGILMNCNMCGTEAELFTAMIEGIELKVCEKCARYGTQVAKIVQLQPAVRRRVQAVAPEVIQMPVSGISRIVKDRREALGLRQEDLARRISEKVSIIHKIETGSFTPGIELAQKLESFLKVKLIATVGSGEEYVGVKKPSDITIGDFIKIKK